MNISGQVVKTSQLSKKTLGLGDSLLALINSPLETVTVPVSEFVTFVSNQIALGTYTLDTVTTAGNTTTNVINVGGVNSPYLQLNTVSPGSQAVGRFVWNDTDGTVDLRLKGNNVTLQLGQETVVRVVNKTGADLLESQYKVVRVRIASEGGAQGQRLAVVLAQGNNDPDSVTTLGIVTENIGNNQEGFITVFGNVNGINTTGSLQGETWADGDVLFLSPTTPGSLTKVKPVAPNHTVVMGYVVYAHQNNGKIFVKVDNGYELEELHDVLPTPYVNNGVLYRDTTANLWRSATVSTLLGYTPVPTSRTLTINGTSYDLSADRSWTISTGITIGTTPITSGTVGRILFEGTGNVVSESANLFWDNTNGRLGVGTATPLRAIDVFASNPEIATRIATNGTGRFSFLFSGGGEIASISLTGSSGELRMFASNTYFPTFYSSGSERMRIPTTGNVLINTTTDAGFRLDVNGTFRTLVGTETNPFRLEHTNGNYMTMVVGAGSALAAGQFGMYFNGTPMWSWNGAVFRLHGNTISTASNPNTLVVQGGYGGSTVGTSIRLSSNTPNQGQWTATTGAQVTVEVGNHSNETWAPSSGNASYTILSVAPRINTSGTYAGIVTGFAYNPTLTSVTGVTHRAIHTVTGDVLLGTTSGNVGIGTNSPTTYMTEQRILAISGGPGTQISMVGSRTTNDILGTLAFWNDANRVADINSIRYNNDTSGAIRFRVADSGSLSEAARVVSNGNFLIGSTTDSGYKLDVNGTTRVVGAITATADGHRFGNLQVRTSGSAGTTGQGIVVTGIDTTFQFHGSGAPADMFQFGNWAGASVVGPISNADKSVIRIYGGFSTGPTSGYSGNTLSITPTYNLTGAATHIVRGIYYNPTLTSLTNATHRAIETVTGDVIFGSTSGNVLIGTTTSSAFRLDVNGIFALGSAGGRLYSTAGNTLQANFGNAQFSVGNSGGESIDLSANSTGEIRFSTASVTNRLVVKNSGNVLIGTGTDAGYKFDVNGTARVQTGLIVSATNPTAQIAGALSFSSRISGNLNGAISSQNIASLLIDESAYSGTGSNLISYAIYAGRSYFDRLNVGITSTSYTSSNVINDTASASLRLIGYNVLTGGSGNGNGTLLLTDRTSGTMLGMTATYGGGGSRLTIFNQYSDGPSSRIKINLAGADTACFFGDGSLQIGNGETTIASAILSASSTTRGFLPPRMTSAQRTAIASPAAGLIVFDTDIQNLCFFRDGVWVQVSFAAI